MNRKLITHQMAAKKIEEAYKLACTKNENIEIWMYVKNANEFLENFQSLSELAAEAHKHMYIGTLHAPNNGYVEMTLSPPGKKEKSFIELKASLKDHKKQVKLRNGKPSPYRRF